MLFGSAGDGASLVSVVDAGAGRSDGVPVGVAVVERAGTSAGTQSAASGTTVVDVVLVGVGVLVGAVVVAVGADGHGDCSGVVGVAPGDVLVGCALAAPAALIATIAAVAETAQNIRTRRDRVGEEISKFIIVNPVWLGESTNCAVLLRRVGRINRIALRNVGLRANGLIIPIRIHCPEPHGDLKRLARKVRAIVRIAFEACSVAERWAVGPELLSPVT